MTVISIENVKVRKAASVINLPTNYDTSRIFDFLQPPVNQGACGACWAISTTQVMRDRLNMWRQRHGLTPNIPSLSFQLVIDCAANCITYKGRKGCAKSCNGGFLVTGFKYLETKGTTREKFYPNRYTFVDGLEHIEKMGKMTKMEERG